jgi:hypothetical protein
MDGASEAVVVININQPSIAKTLQAGSEASLPFLLNTRRMQPFRPNTPYAIFSSVVDRIMGKGHNRCGFKKSENS